MVHAHDQAVAAQQDYQRKVTAFNQAKEADSANGILDGVKKTTENSLLGGSPREAVHPRDRIHRQCSQESDRTAQEHLQEGICPLARRGEEARDPLSAITKGKCRGQAER